MNVLSSITPYAPVRTLAPSGEVISMEPSISTGERLLSMAAAGLCTYHGYKRNNSIPWAIGWGFLGALFPIVTPAIAIAQGFGKRAGS